MFDSAIPRLNARAGYFFAKFTVMVDFDRSASSVTIRSVLGAQIEERFAERGAAGLGRHHFFSRALSSSTIARVDESVFK